MPPPPTSFTRIALDASPRLCGQGRPFQGRPPGHQPQGHARAVVNAAFPSAQGTGRAPCAPVRFRTAAALARDVRSGSERHTWSRPRSTRLHRSERRGAGGAPGTSGGVLPGSGSRTSTDAASCSSIRASMRRKAFSSSWRTLQASHRRTLSGTSSSSASPSSIRWPGSESEASARPRRSRSPSSTGWAYRSPIRWPNYWRCRRTTRTSARSSRKPCAPACRSSRRWAALAGAEHGEADGASTWRTSRASSAR